MSVREPKHRSQVYEERQHNHPGDHEQQRRPDPPGNSAEHQQGNAGNHAGLTHDAARKSDMAKGLHSGKQSACEIVIGHMPQYMRFPASVIAAHTAAPVAGGAALR